jgi:hypothetical protein
MIPSYGAPLGVIIYMVIEPLYTGINFQTHNIFFGECITGILTPDPPSPHYTDKYQPTITLCKIDFVLSETRWWCSCHTTKVTTGNWGNIPDSNVKGSTGVSGWQLTVLSWNYKLQYLYNLEIAYIATIATDSLRTLSLLLPMMLHAVHKIFMSGKVHFIINKQNCHIPYFDRKYSRLQNLMHLLVSSTVYLLVKEICHFRMTHCLDNLYTNVRYRWSNMYGHKFLLGFIPFIYCV